MAVSAWWRAVDALAQAFSTLMTGIRPIPSARRITWPRIDSWPVITPAAALPTKAIWISSGATPASSRAAVVASAPRDLRPRSRCLPKRVIPTPATTASDCIAAS